MAAIKYGNISVVPFGAYSSAPPQVHLTWSHFEHSKCERIGCYWPVEDKAQDPAEHPTVHRTAPHNQDLLHAPAKGLPPGFVLGCICGF